MREGQLERLLVGNQCVQAANESMHSSRDADSGGIASITAHLKRTRLADDYRSALDSDELLDLVFEYVGVGEYLYAAGVSRRWRARYMNLCYYRWAEEDEEGPLWTSYTRAIITAARLQLALDSDLTVQDVHDVEPVEV